ncbi:hypothetical protein GCM10027343_37700 [Noviherbaspirillum agri]
MMSLSVLAWLGLLALTGISLLLGAQFGTASWMPFLVAGIIWLKGSMVARYFIESNHAHPFIAWVLRAFIAFTPLGLILTAVLSG